MKNAQGILKEEALKYYYCPKRDSNGFGQRKWLSIRDQLVFYTDY